MTASLTLAASAEARADGDPLPLSAPGKTERIEPAGSMSEGGYDWQYFRNLDYPCSISGYQTFAVGTPIGSDPAKPMPLWVRMRGGGVGWFDANGNPKPSAGKMTEDKFSNLVGFAVNSELNERVNTLPGGFRDVSVSMCSHDIYAGGDQLDPNNPNLTPEGGPRHTNGLLATKAAIQYVQRRFPTTRTFLHGTSAGSVGTWSVAYSLIKQDRPATGFVADSGIANLQAEIDQDQAAGPCARGADVLAAISARVHPGLQGMNEARQLIERGELYTPVFNIWNRDDQNSCGSVDIPCTMSDGSVKVLGGMECKMAAISRVIQALPASRHSVNMRVCVRSKTEAPGTCTRHVLTTVDPAQYPNTDPVWPADFDSVIGRWVIDRLNDEPVPLEAKLPRARELHVTQGHRVALECKAGGYERRTCRVELTTRRHGKRVRIGKGEKVIRYEADSRDLTVKLNKRGRKLVRKAPKRGLDAGARATVSERYTERAGIYRRPVRLKR